MRPRKGPRKGPRKRPPRLFVAAAKDAFEGWRRSLFSRGKLSHGTKQHGELQNYCVSLKKIVIVIILQRALFAEFERQEGRGHLEREVEEGRGLDWPCSLLDTFIGLFYVGFFEF